MEVSLESAVAQALSARHLNQAVETGTAVLARTLDAQRQVAADLLKMMGVGRNLDAVG